MPPHSEEVMRLVRTFGHLSLVSLVAIAGKVYGLPALATVVAAVELDELGMLALAGSTVSLPW